MKKKFKILFAMFLMLVTALLCSSCITTSIVLIEEKRRENHLMECELVGEPQMTVTQNEEGMYEVTVDFMLKNNGNEDCYDWNCVVSIYDENGCVLDGVSCYESSFGEVDKVLKMGEETAIHVESLQSHYQPVSVRVWNICLYAEYMAIFY